MTYRYWPLRELRVQVGRLVLRPMTEADLEPLADLKPFDVEDDPALPSYPVDDLRTLRGIRVHQSYWRTLGNWRPESWNLGFVALRDDEIVGVQDLEANDFAVLRTVETASWVPTGLRGQGVGKAMRLGVLALAFDGLGAQVATTEAWHDNAASLGVSRALGYLDNGVRRHLRLGTADGADGEDGADEMVGLRMTVERWRELHPAPDVQITGLRAGLPLFGLL